MTALRSTQVSYLALLLCLSMQWISVSCIWNCSVIASHSAEAAMEACCATDLEICCDDESAECDIAKEYTISGSSHCVITASVTALVPIKNAADFDLSPNTQRASAFHLTLSDQQNGQIIFRWKAPPSIISLEHLSTLRI